MNVFFFWIGRYYSWFSFPCFVLLLSPFCLFNRLMLFSFRFFFIALALFSLQFWISNEFDIIIYAYVTMQEVSIDSDVHFIIVIGLVFRKKRKKRSCKCMCVNEQVFSWKMTIFFIFNFNWIIERILSVLFISLIEYESINILLLFIFFFF